MPESRIVQGSISPLRLDVPEGEGRWYGLDALEAFATREEMVKMLVHADTQDGTGAAVAYLLHIADKYPHILKAILRSPVERIGHRPREIIDVLNGVAGKG